MTDVLKIGKKAFTWSVIALTILWSVGAFSLAQTVVNAATCPSLSAGDLFKVPGNSAVYLLNASMERLYFPHANVYKSWYKDYSGIEEIPTTCVDAYPSPKSAPFGVNYRAGSLVKVTISPSVYVVLPGNKLAKLGSEQVAKDLFGTNWAKAVSDVADPFWPNYAERGSDVTESVPQEGMLIKVSGSSDVWLVKNGKLVKVDGAVIADQVRTVTQTVADKLVKESGSVTASSVYENPSQLSGSGSTVPPNTAAGSLSVMLADDTPRNSFALASAARVPFTKLKLSASSAGPVTINSFRVKRGGAPAVNADFSTINVIDEEGNLLNDSGKTLNSDDYVTFTEDIVIPAGTTKYYTIVADMAAAAAMTNGNVPTLGVESVETGSSVSGVPVYGNAVTTNENVTLGTVTLEEGSTISNQTKQVGATNVNLASLKVTVATEDFQVGRIVLYNSGTAGDTDVQNFKLKYNNNTIVDGVMKNKYLTFDLKNCGADCKIEKGQNKTFEVYGDLINGSARTMNLDVQRTTHVLARDLKSNVYVVPTNSASSMTNTITISQGKVNVTKTDAVATGNIPENASNVALASFNFKVTGEPVDIRTLVFRVTTSGTVAPSGFDSLNIYNASGKALIGGVDVVGATSGVPGYATSTDSFTLPVGDNILTVKAKIDSTPASDDKVIVSVDMNNTTNFDARGVNSGDTITLGTYATPQAFVTGNTMTIQTSALRVTQLSSVPSTTYAAGTSNITLAEVLLDASGSSEDLKVTQFKIVDATESSAKPIDLQDIRLFVDTDGDSYNGSGTQTALSEVNNGSDSTAANDETFTFNLGGSDQFVVKAGKRLVVTVKGSITGGAGAGKHVFRVNASNDVSATGVTTGNTVVETIDSSAQPSTVTVGTAGGTVQVSIDPSNIDSKQYAAGTQGVSLAVFNFLATTTENVELDYLYLTQRVTDTNSAAYQDYDLLYLVNEAGTTVASITPTSTKPYFDFADNAFIVPTSDSDGVRLTLKANLANIGPSQNVTVGGHRLGFNISSAGDVVAKGDSTGTGAVEYLSTVDAPNGNTHYMYKGVPTFEKLASSGTLSSSAELYKFKISANTADIGLYKFTFEVVTSSVTLTQVEVYDVTNPSSEVLLYSNSSQGTFTTGPVFDVLLDDDNPTGLDGGEERIVSKDQPRTFVIRGSFSGVSSGDSVTVRMAGDGALSDGTSGNGGTFNLGSVNMASSTSVDAGINDDFIWSDRHASGHSTSTNDWVNGYLVNGLSSVSTSAQVLSL